MLLRDKTDKERKGKWEEERGREGERGDDGGGEGKGERTWSLGSRKNQSITKIQVIQDV